MDFRDCFVNKKAECNDTLTGQKEKAINAILKKHGMKVDQVITAPTVTTYKAKLDVETNVNAILRQGASFKVATDDNGCRICQDGSMLCIETKGGDGIVPMNELYARGYIDADPDKLLMTIGIDTAGQRIYYDLRKAPHMVVAGTTGSGKTVFLHTVALSLLMRHYNDIDMTLIDAKGNEFNSYARLDNVTFIDNAGGAVMELEEAVREMERRYDRLSLNGCRDIDAYNRRFFPSMRRKVIIIDEFADLMLQSKSSVETAVVRLAQKARACGIHLIIGTQSPRRNVITGLISANIPTKVAMSCTDVYESRVILGRKGPESLRGRGDMLFLPNGYRNPIRCQGAYVSDSERDAVISRIYGSFSRQRDEQILNEPYIYVKQPEYTEYRQPVRRNGFTAKMRRFFGARAN